MAELFSVVPIALGMDEGTTVRAVSKDGRPTGVVTQPFLQELVFMEVNSSDIRVVAFSFVLVTGLAMPPCGLSQSDKIA